MFKLLSIQIPTNRVFGLDLLRAFAILFVVYEHGIPFLAHFIPQTFLDFFQYDGVSLFFVLSGFLIGGILIRSLDYGEGVTQALFRFWTRRWFRTIPNYLLIILILIIPNILMGTPLPSGVLQCVFFVQNLITPHPEFFPEAWSLSIEEWFYLTIAPGVFFLVYWGLPKKKAVLSFLIVLLLFSITFRYYRYLHMPVMNIEDWHIYFRKQVLTRMDSLMFGVLGAWLKYYIPHLWSQWSKPGLILGMLFIFIHKMSFYLQPTLGFDLNAWYCVWSFSFDSLGVLMLLPFLSSWNALNLKTLSHSITLISLVSYSMYLINLSVVQSLVLRQFYKVIPFLQNHSVGIALSFALYLSFTLIGSILIYKYFEVPTTALRERFFKKKS
jgi:peptidoglycan/LPS O-acetylase OafA/YrhL